MNSLSCLSWLYRIYMYHGLFIYLFLSGSGPLFVVFVTESILIYSTLLYSRYIHIYIYIYTYPTYPNGSGLTDADAKSPVLLSHLSKIRTYLSRHQLPEDGCVF
ncbi:hypothetical protein GGR50DRAFT_647697 [Xylaria sp. CBS 124048]|nr:hypothetical protein GGR50DRAFT_647697 [Xylaria sp. CBS 124048]